MTNLIRKNDRKNDTLQIKKSIKITFFGRKIKEKSKRIYKKMIKTDHNF